ncbi:hypothetical protein KKI23_03250 [Patescibacteria group bacterium]|nr:hypothetical protein [Patescibacteria group bacterium]
MVKKISKARNIPVKKKPAKKKKSAEKSVWVEATRPERLLRSDLTNEETKIKKMADVSRTLFWFGFGCLTLIVLGLIVIAVLLLVSKGTNLLELL